MNPAFATFRHFDSPDDARATLVPLLTELGIAHEVVAELVPAPPGVRGEKPEAKTAVRFARTEFPRVQNLLVGQAVRATLAEAEPDHYLFSFGTDELLDVVKKPDEWSAYDVVLARHLLHQRGLTVGNDQMNALVRERLQTLAAHEPPSRFWLGVGYALALLGGLGGVLFGLHYAHDRKVLPTGQPVYTYDEPTRRHGRRLLWLGGGVFGALALAGLYFLLDLALEKWD